MPSGSGPQILINQHQWGMAMRKNPVKSDLLAGKHVFGTMVFEFFTPGMPQIAKTAGAEFVLFDMEHSGVTIETLKGQIAACRGIGLVPMVRVPALQYHFIARCLDMGAMGIMVPMVESAAQAREIVSATRYPPSGRRGAMRPASSLPPIAGSRAAARAWART